MKQNWDNRERRHYIRIEKHFVISYYDKNDATVKHNISQLKNISLGGMCFITSQQYEPRTKMGVELKTPYLDQAVHIEGAVLQSHEKVPHMIYETRLSFDDLNTAAQVALKKIVDTFSKLLMEKNNG